MVLNSNQRFGLRILGAIVVIWFLKTVFFSSKKAKPSAESEIEIANVFERVTIGTPLGSSALNPQKYPFLQSRIGRESGHDLFDTDIHAGIEDFWHRFQLPFATAPETVHLDEQVIKGALEELLAFNGWAAAACTTLTRPYASDSDDPYLDLSKPGLRYFFGLVVHSADHFFIDQLAVVVQAAKKIGTQTIFVSIVDYASSDSTPFLCDLAEAVMVLLGIPFRIRRVPPMTADPAASYYPLEEAYTRNLALEPLFELYERRKVSFARVIWLKGFTCPNDLLETLRISLLNHATMVCGMDWKEHNGFFIYNDRWRTRDLDGNLFRGSKSTSPLEEAPPRDSASASRYNQHLPFQVFCCESGSHIVDPATSYYLGIRYRSSVAGIFNITSAGSGKSPVWTEGPCMDSSQMHFCRDVWLMSAKEGVKEKARDAKRKEKAGEPRGLSREMEELIRVVAPRLSIPADQEPPPSELASNSVKTDEVVGENQGNVDLIDSNAHLPQADFDKTDGVGAARDLAAKEAKEEAVKDGEEKDDIALLHDDKAVGGKPLPKGQQKRKRDEIPEEPKAQQDQSDSKIASPNKPKEISKTGEETKPEEGTTRAEEEVEPEVSDDDPQPGSSNWIGNVPNSDFKPARILVNPRCITTYAGVSHTKLALDLFGSGDDVEPSRESGGKYHFDEWLGAPSAFVCQEMRTTGGRLSSKQQRRTNFQVGRTLRGGWRPGDYV
ncbi:cryptococcal mannosyltransferase 1-domain-containing protein [Phakopsora pachyrhizi]|uniref:Cryptococcal mannosyltransferase 1-domain-containing protein n=1 Tax=Phakopsora pachyrhizi TaxID=170000 RepID=A0AAV0ARR2_PHAPC|nr:cryptococcal mannosyltransferase 1-domain-containing protein [Phakopsora pachyrhizi]CAH7670742.1 cryptococcal mannosyltransferase 1-domain-containing protein [Phakopsora pachyrhizi]